ncbi:MAG: GTP-binding protein [Methanomassiliicoccus sp.]|nr:GTP-binding protein [Methanomassiliicoccus sp.]
MTTRIAILGGFLGSGKTTLMIKLATELAKSGSAVGLITNDQGETLVDTQYSRDMGFNVAEVLRGCFCCKFNDLIMSARGLVADHKPDFIIAEPVGSCTDLQATVMAPLRSIYGDEFEVAPLMVLVDAGSLKEAVPDPETLNGYLRKHQIEEAEVVVLSKVDTVEQKDLAALREVLRNYNPSAEIIDYSAVSGDGVKAILETVRSGRRSQHSPVDIDYDRYAAAEAELGWYNGTFRFTLPARTDSYDVALKLIGYISSQYGDADLAHVKLILRSEKNALKMNLVNGNVNVDGVKGSRYGEGATVLNLNARVVSSPDKLAEVIREAVRIALDAPRVEVEGFEDTCFSPSRPNPTHRMTD